MTGKIDLHMHSVYSDGTDDPEALLRKVRERGIGTFALTDHDTVDGALEMEKIIPDDMHFIRGIEFSTQCDEGKFHILGYNYDPENEEFNKTVVWAKELRLIKLEKRIDILKERGIKFDGDEKKWLRTLSCPGRPHLAQILLHRGYVKSVAQAFDTYLRGMSAGDAFMLPEEAVKAILAGGGIPVWAHPFGEKRSRFHSREEVERRLEYLKRCGIRGIECCYSQYNQEEIAYLKDLAVKNGLCISGGSDYHGTVKPGIVPGKLNADGTEIDPAGLTLISELGLETK